MILRMTYQHRSEMEVKGTYLDGEICQFIQEISPRKLLIGLEKKTQMVIFDITTK